MNMIPLLNAMEQLDRKLRAYEHTYGLRSETFALVYAAGKTPVDPQWMQDWADWAHTYELRKSWQGACRVLATPLLLAQPVYGFSPLVASAPIPATLTPPAGT
jgi:hypothetical protein